MAIYPPGARIAGSYEVAGRPLMGGMGIVYLCFDHNEGRPVALKTFKPHFLPDRDARDRLLREGTAWVDLGRHPHVVRCYRVLRIGHGREVYLVLELVAKEQGRDDASLRSWLAPGSPLPIEQALLFGLQIARGMAHAVATVHGFIHRDLKPENVLVGADRLSKADVNRLRVTDFGLAAVVQASGQQSAAGDQHLAAGEGEPVQGTQDPSGHLGRTQLTRGVVGTPLYMAPEQWRGEAVTVATDVYALGCMLYEMLAGQRPVEGHSLGALERAHCRGEARPLPAGVPAAVGEVVSHCLAVEPEARYGSWDQVEGALGAAYAGVSGRAVPGPEPPGEAGREERVAAGWSYSAIGNSYLDIGKAEVALGYFERTREAGSAEGERRLEAAGLTHLGLACARLGDAGRAIGYYERALAVLREIGDRRGEGAALGNLGGAYLRLGDARRAIGYYEQALAIDREIGDRRGEGNALSGLGIAYTALGDARRAIGYHEQHLVITREIGDRRGEGSALGNLGIAYAELGDAQRAIEYHQQALRISQEIGDVRTAAIRSANLGMSLAQVGRMGEALPLAEQAARDFRQAGYPQQAQQLERMLARIRGMLR